MIVGHAAYCRVMSGASETAWIFIAEVTHHRATIIIATGLTVINFRCCGITVVVVGIILVASIYFMSVNIRIEVSMVLGIAMTKSCGRQTMSVVIDYHGAETYLITSVPVYVGNSIVMIALSIPCGTCCIVTPAPTFNQFVCGWIYIIGNHLMASVDTACQENAGLTTVQIGCTEEMLCGTVTIAVTPSTRKVGLTVF